MKSTTKVGLAQIGENFGGQYYLPYSIGLLHAYAEKHLPRYGEFEFMLPVFRKEPLQTLVPRLCGADIVFFSTYVWNYRFSLEAARQIKLANRECVIVFGGPQVPELADPLQQMLQEHPFVDIACYGEGEIPFVRILECLSERAWTDVPSIGFLGPQGNLTRTAPAKRIRNLDTIPSPFLEGIFDPLLATFPDIRWSAMLETNRGCPFNCSYCTWGNQDKNKVYIHDMDRVAREIDWISRNRIEFVFCCDANFGLFREKDIQIARKVAENKRTYGYPMAFCVQSTKNATETIFESNKILHDAGLQKGVNLALQSVHEKTLEAIHRNNISNQVYRNLQQLFSEAGISTFSDMILGLPNETYDSFADGTASVIEGGQHNRIQFINLTVLENSEMSLPEYQKEYGMIVKGCRMISHHTRIDEGAEVEERQDLVLGTTTMPPEDWVKTRVFCWLTSLLHFSKLLQIPFVLLNRIGGVGYRKLIEILDTDRAKYPVISEINGLLRQKAISIQAGDCEFVPSEEWLSIWWPADEYVFIKLCSDNLLGQFYQEAKDLITCHLNTNDIAFPKPLLSDALRLNAGMIKKLRDDESEHIRVGSNLYEVYRAALTGRNIPLVEGDFHYNINRHPRPWNSLDEWCREVVWYGSKRGSYLWDCMSVESRASGLSVIGDHQ